MDVKSYLTKKKAGLAQLMKIAGGYAYAVKRFDPETGKALDPQIVPVSVDELNKQKTDLQSQIVDIDATLKDIAALQ